MNQVHPLRLLIKALLLFILANLLFSIFNPPVGRASAYNVLFPGRTRFPFGGGIQENNITVDDLDAMFASHIITAPKRLDEFRVLILGDSSVWGTLLRADQTISAQFNAVNLMCSEKQLHFYNLGYPHPSLIQDSIILDQAIDYEPDLIIWMVTLNAVRQRPMNEFLLENFDRVAAFDRRFGLHPEYESAAPEPKTFYEQTLIGQRNQLARLLLLQSLGPVWAGTGLDIAQNTRYEKLSNDQSASLNFAGLKEPADIHAYLQLEYLKAGIQRSGNIPVLVVNEPIYIATGTSADVRYNTMYPRWAFDQYRQILAKDAASYRWNYLDLWDAIPPEHFTNNPLHLDVKGELLLANLLSPAVSKIGCP